MLINCFLLLSVLVYCWQQEGRFASTESTCTEE